ncbi:hypothetical protein [Priestia endophytica]|uniref:hypothetical protein n=1 Tax=Priestia endophytica TaxID=135735 RepID=UPI0022803E68|nr:hypothetical protein [Priestia endophytica]MCY8231144.1 hypothetical protein [Priestia endophytica]
MLKEQGESPDSLVTGSHNFTEAQYFKEVQKWLQEFDKQNQVMNQHRIETSLLSLTKPEIEGITNLEITVKIRRNDSS